MKNKYLKWVLLVVAALVFADNALAQRTWSSKNYVPISINSGNPAFPYPQFLEYKVGKSLAKYNAEGVTHADMEKAGREAYEIMSHRCRYSGGTHCGVPYISFNNFSKFGNEEMPLGGYEFCTEGDGYMLLASAIFADQPTFNGLWMWIHDNRLSKVKKYSDGEWLRKGLWVDGRPAFQINETGSFLAGRTILDHHIEDTDLSSDADADYDIAMALLIAYKQWGEFMHHNGKPVIGGDGNPISYKQAAFDYITAIVDTIPVYDKNDVFLGYRTGDIGVDGYPKGGNTWGELTTWADNQDVYGFKLSQFPSMVGASPSVSYAHNAPSYFNEFAYWLEKGDGNGTAWQINQFKRAEAASDWLAGQLYEQGALASIGKYSINEDNTVEFSNYNSSGDFCFAWRNSLNYLWHDDAECTWNAKTHAVEWGGNNWQYKLAKRHAQFLKEPLVTLGGDRVCGKLGDAPDDDQCEWFGPAQIQQNYYMNGMEEKDGHTNYVLGASAASVVALGDLELLGDMYRQSELIWKDASLESRNLTEDERYIESMPAYLNGWFRVLGLLTNSGNLHAPRNMEARANCKVYMTVDKTYAYVGDKAY